MVISSPSETPEPQDDGFDIVRKKGNVAKGFLWIHILIVGLWVFLLLKGEPAQDALRLVVPAYVLFLVSQCLVVGFAVRERLMMTILALGVAAVGLIEMGVGVVGVMAQVQAPEAGGLGRLLPWGVVLVSFLLAIPFLLYARSLFRRASRIPKSEPPAASH